MKKSFSEGLNSFVNKQLSKIDEDYNYRGYKISNYRGYKKIVAPNGTETSADNDKEAKQDIDAEFADEITNDKSLDEYKLTEAKDEIINGQKVDYIDGERYVQLFDFG